MKKNRAISLTELIVVVALIAVVAGGLFALIHMPISANNLSNKEYDIQTAMRQTSEILNNTVRNSSAALILTKNDKIFENEWNYLLSDGNFEGNGKSRILFYEWNGTTHKEKVIDELPFDKMEYGLKFIKGGEKGDLIQFSIAMRDKEGKVERELSTKLAPLNTALIEDESDIDYTLTPPTKNGNCIAFRTKNYKISSTETPSTKEGYDRIFVAFLIDVSKNMLNDENDVFKTEYGVGDGYKKQKIHHIMEELYGLLDHNNFKESVIPVDVRFYPYSKSSFYGMPNFEPKVYVGEDKTHYGRIINVVEEYCKDTSTAIDNIKNTSPFDPRTNIGDALRMATFEMQDYKEAHRGENIKYYTVVVTGKYADTYTTMALIQDNGDSEGDSQLATRSPIYVNDASLVGSLIEPKYKDGTPVTSRVLRDKMKDTANMFYDVPDESESTVVRYRNYTSDDMGKTFDGDDEGLRNWMSAEGITNNKLFVNEHIKADTATTMGSFYTRYFLKQYRNWKLPAGSNKELMFINYGKISCENDYTKKGIVDKLMYTVVNGSDTHSGEKERVFMCKTRDSLKAPFKELKEEIITLSRKK